MKIRKILMLLSLSLILGSSSIYACPELVGGFTEGIAEDNDMWIAEDDMFNRFMKDKSDVIDEKMFNEIIDRVAAVYRPVIEKMGAKLVMNKRWSDGTVNAYAQQMGNNWHVTMFGGLARHKETTPDGFALVVCHELGHHIAGYPTYPRDWASSEGQSDYFATAKCFKAVYGDDNNERFAADAIFDIGNPIEEKCSEAYAFSDKQYFTCIRSALGGQSLANLLADLRRSPKPKAETPSTKKVRKHYNAHPKAQCRFDTYFQGSLCTKPVDKLYGTEDYKDGYCTRTEGFKMGVRPLCWFSPTQAEKESISLDSWF